MTDQQMTDQTNGFAPAGTEWLQALHAAQREAKRIEKTKPIPDRNGKTRFYVAASEEFTHESRRVLHAVGMGWFREQASIAEVNAHTGVLRITATYIVYHTPSGQARTFRADWVARGDTDSISGADTSLTRRFIQGLLSVPVVDEGAEFPADSAQAPSHGAPPSCAHPAHCLVAHGGSQWNSATSCWVSEFACTACGASTGWGPTSAPQQQQQEFHSATPNPAPVPTPAAPPQQQAVYGGQSAQPALPPVAADPVVQLAAALLGSTPVLPQQMEQEQAAPAGDPNSPEALRDTLIASGLDPENALQVAMLDSGRIVEPELVDQMRGWAWSAHNGDTKKITEAWLAVGFTPVPALPLEQRPRPTGLQAKTFLSAMNFKPATAGS